MGQIAVVSLLVLAAFGCGGGSFSGADPPVHSDAVAPSIDAPVVSERPSISGPDGAMVQQQDSGVDVDISWKADAQDEQTSIDAGSESADPAEASEAATEACTPVPCFAGHQCGLVADSCGGTQQCGECNAGDVCGGGVCTPFSTLGCVPTSAGGCGPLCVQAFSNGDRTWTYYSCGSASALPKDNCVQKTTNLYVCSCCSDPTNCTC